MKPRISFPKQILAALAISFIAAAYPLAAFGSREVILAVAAGAALGTANIFLGYLAIVYGLNKSMSTFMKAVIGGMGVRLLLLIGGLVFFILVLDLHVVALTASLFYFYTVYLALEILFVQKNVQTKSSSDAGSIG